MVKVGLHQGPALSPQMSSLVMDIIAEGVKEASFSSMMFADDIALCGNTREEVEKKLKA